MLLVAACATPENSGAQTLGRSEIGRQLSFGFETIARSYIDPVDLGRVASAGLAGLAEIDARLKVDRRGDSVRLFAGDSAAAAFVAPRADDYQGWARVVGETLQVGRDISPALRAADSETIYKAFFTAALGDLDRFSRYWSRKEADSQRASRDGFGGVGIRIEPEPRGVKIVEVMPATPAEDGGLKSGDLITHVDRYSVIGLDQEAVVDRLRGPVNSLVQVTLTRKGIERPFTRDLLRELIVLPTVFYERRGDVALIAITSFNVGTPRAMAEALHLARREMGDAMRGIVLDLRGNPGGLLDKAVDVADEFVSTGPLLSVRGRHPQSRQHYDADSADFSTGLPVVTVVNATSASAAEVLAAALQDTGRSVVIGAVSYGKGSVQQVVSMPNGGEMTLTWARLFSPSDHSFNKIGVVPNLCTSIGTPSATEILRDLPANIERMRTLIAYARQVGQDDVEGQKRVREGCQTRPGGPDVEIDVAVALLQQPNLYAASLQALRPVVAISAAPRQARQPAAN